MPTSESAVTMTLCSLLACVWAHLLAVKFTIHIKCGFVLACISTCWGELTPFYGPLMPRHGALYPQ